MVLCYFKFCFKKCNILLEVFLDKKQIFPGLQFLVHGCNAICLFHHMLDLWVIPSLLFSPCLPCSLLPPSFPSSRLPPFFFPSSLPPSPPSLFFPPTLLNKITLNITLQVLCIINYMTKQSPKEFLRMNGPQERVPHLEI